MMIPFRTEADARREAPRVVAHLRRGGLIAYPTETVYGLGSTLDPIALARLARLKRRDETKPFLLLVEDARQATGLEWTDAAQRLAKAFWPGPLTLALRATKAFPPSVVGAAGTVAIRATSHPEVRILLGALGEPITSTSANRPDGEPASTAGEAARVLRDLGSQDDVPVLDGGTLDPSPPSTIVDCHATPPRILREGAIGRDALQRVVEDLDD